MNKFMTGCLALSAIALLVTFFAWVLSPSLPTVTLSAKEWHCIESVPDGLNATCIQYTRMGKPKLTPALRAD